MPKPHRTTNPLEAIHEERDEKRATNVPLVRVHRTEKQKKRNRRESTTKKSVNATGRPTLCGQTLSNQSKIQPAQDRKTTKKEKDEKA